MEFFIKTDSIGGLTDEQFFHFCQENDTLRIEKNSKGEIIVMAPTGSETGWFNLGIASAVYNWNQSASAGYVFDSSTGFTLPNNAVRSADVAFITKERWSAVPKEERKKFAPICPDFVIEILSESDSQFYLNDKMNDWMTNGCKLAWLIDPKTRTTKIYRPRKKIQSVPFSTPLQGEDILPGFSIDLTEIFTD